MLFLSYLQEIKFCFQFSMCSSPIWKARVAGLQEQEGRMLSRPKPGESEADLLHFQNQFLAARASPAVKIVKKADKRKGKEGSTDAETPPLHDSKDVVMLDGKFIRFFEFLRFSVSQPNVAFLLHLCPSCSIIYSLALEIGLSNVSSIQ